MEQDLSVLYSALDRANQKGIYSLQESKNIFDSLERIAERLQPKEEVKDLETAE